MEKLTESTGIRTRDPSFSLGCVTNASLYRSNSNTLTFLQFGQVDKYIRLRMSPRDGAFTRV